MNAYTEFDRDSRGEAPCPLHRAEELTSGGRTAKIMLGDSLYTLRITRQGKLILTK
ncbi:hemin uptake protein HemP [uncultured Maritimibacter sp.]|jgi:hemin uptake protein HemP|uniref:hemin uptake protein HemP n=1 Tax=uncultured Maritimibacter sp. TaxID=991866 RepID=UPI000A93501E|nr:hemin uptake protein HemP [uncultured Maritimibacter sp.]